MNVNAPAQTAHVTNTLGETLEFSGSITVTTGSSSPRILDIVAEMSNGWATTIAPSSENISDGENVPFNASVAVPPAASATTRATLTVTGTFLAVPGFPSSQVTCGGNGQVNVAQYYGVDADSSKLRVEVEGGPTGIVASVIAHNLGNGRDRFTLDIADTDRLLLEDEGLHSNLPIRVDIDPGAETSIPFSINASSDALPGTYNFTVTLTSINAPQLASDNLVFVVVVKPSIIQSLIPSFTTAIVIAAVVAALVGVVVGRRHLRRKKAALEARRQLQKVLRLRREGGEAGGAVDEGGPGYGSSQAPAGPFDAAPSDVAQESAPYPVDELPSAPELPVADDKVRVRVKARPRE